MPFDHTVNKTVKTREGTIAGASKNHIILSSNVNGGESVIIQDGQWLYSDGSLMDEDDVPDWAWEQFKSASDETRASVGFEPLPESEKHKKAMRGPRVEIGGPRGGNTPMQLNAAGPGGEAADKASPVPQGDEDDDLPPTQAQPAKAPVPAAKPPVRTK